jgi:glycosyltransferase involved in cell wall biosynthesis
LDRSARRHIVHLTAPARFGGLESVVAALAAGAADRGHLVQVLCLLGLDPTERCAAFDRLPDRGVEVIELRNPGRSYRRERDQVRTRLRSIPRAVLHSHGYHADIVAARAARGLPNPTVSTVHGFTGGRAKNRLYEWLDLRALRRLAAVVAVSAPLRDRLAAAGIVRERIRLVPNAYAGGASPYDRGEARGRLGLPPEGTVVGWIGRLSPEKAPDIFLEAIGRTNLELRASIVGDGAMRPALQAQAKLLGITDRIHWHGEVAEAGRLLPAFDVLLLSSRTEGTPIVLLEAMAAGVPVISTAVGGIPDVVGDGEAVLVPPEHPDLLADALRATLDAPDLARARAARARARLADGYGVEQWLDRYDGIYQDLLASGVPA